MMPQRGALRPSPLSLTGPHQPASPGPSCTTTPSWLPDRRPRDPGRWEAAANARLHGHFSSSHYLFEDRFGRPGKGNDKGKVEGLVGFIRRNFLVPVPRAESFAALNDALAEQCRRRQAARLRGHKETIGERLERDREASLAIYRRHHTMPATSALDG